MRTATTALSSLLATAMLAGGAMGAAAQEPAGDGGPTRLTIEVTIAGADAGTSLAVEDAGAGITRSVPLSPGVLAQMEALATEYPYFGLDGGVQLGRDYDRLHEFADRFPYMVAEQ
jgi:hypothetical protein